MIDIQVNNMPHEDVVQPQQSEENLPPLNLGKIRKLKDKAKVKTKRILNIDSSDEESVANESNYVEALDEINNSPAFNASIILDKPRTGTASKKERVVSVLHGAVESIVHPKSSIKARATRTTAGKLAKSRPYLSRKADLDFLEAHDALSKAETSRAASDCEDTAASKTEDIDHYQRQVQDLERRRQDIRVAWVTSRHVRRVKAVDTSPQPFPDDRYFEKEDDCGATEFQWGKWIGHRLLHISRNFTAQYIDDYEELPFDLDTFRRHLERLIVVSAPFQTTFTEVRRVYTWEDPPTTIKWMALYFFLLHISHIMTFAYGYIIYMVVKNYFYPTSLQHLREEIERSLDRGATAFKVGEMMDQHGDQDWLKPLITELGPYIQVQIADLANLLEVCYNFYHFSSPYATICTLILLASVFLLTLLTSAEYAFKVFWFIVGMTFFVCWPISSLYPRYRLLVSPVKWIFWDVPTHAEWSILHLRERASIAREAILSEESPEDAFQDVTDSASDTDSFTTAHSTSLAETKDILSFSCTYHHIPGHLIISTTGLRFHSSLPSSTPTSLKPYFTYPFTSLLEMSKCHSSFDAIIDLAKLELTFRDDDFDGGDGAMLTKVVLDHMRQRDKAFNAILGFSGVRWQVLQKRANGQVI